MQCRLTRTKLTWLGLLLPLLGNAWGCETDVTALGEEDGSEVATCGDGVLDDDEKCDDGNEVGGDGCSADCRLIAGFVCPEPGAPCLAIAEAVCGDGVLDSDDGEACDDGNRAGGDGCSADCAEVEFGFVCSVPGAPCVTRGVCGNAVLDSEVGEQCDDANTEDGDGCAADCASVEGGWVCDDRVCTPVCGDGIAVGPEECDNGADNGRGACRVDCTLAEAECGDGILDPAEACDDGNRAANDGCSRTCKIEEGWLCETDEGATQCVSAGTCGDGILEAASGEQCDDGNQASRDGCTQDCQVEPGHECAGEGEGSCVSICGDGMVVGDEECDEGEDNGADLCSPDCRFVVPDCGNTVVDIESGEQCDDGNRVSGDGCSASCLIEPHYVCPTPGEPCAWTQVCGDGLVDGSEACDDANTADDDGCAADCRSIQPGYTCVAGQPCETECGDGVVAGDEECDEGEGNSMGSSCTLDCRLST
ncbi:MAG: DUF4215 domain-containing protein [Polyangiaceae bacterium]|nr:DUF4215 domain-containing protein [Polyangiaceae bacterium]